MDKFPLTKKGFLRLEQELKNLKSIDRPNIIAAIAENIGLVPVWNDWETKYKSLSIFFIVFLIKKNFLLKYSWFPTLC